MVAQIKDKKIMPEFAIDTVVTADGRQIPGMKRMYDIALALGDSILQHGAPGVGKSQAVKQWNQQKVEEYKQRIALGEDVKPWNPDVCDVRLSMKEPVDLIGIPVLTTVDGEQKTVWAVPSMWPKNNGEYSGGVIHLDEFNQGQSAILNASFQLIQDRALGDYKVPDGYLVIASANPSEYNPTVTDLSIPLSNRFTHFNVKADAESWFNYRMNNGGNIDVMTFLKTQRPDLLFDKKAMENLTGCSLDNTLYADIVPTPRSWEVVEHVLALPDFTMDEKQAYCTGRLGFENTTLLFNYLKNKDKYQSWQEILKDGKNFTDEQSTEQFFVTQMTCVSVIANTESDETCRKYVLNFIKATKALTRTDLKIINITALSRLKRLQGKMHIYNALTDAKELVALVIKSLKS